MKYIVVSNVKKKIKDAGKRCGAYFLEGLDRHVDEIIEKSVNQFNGHHKTLDQALLNFIINGV